MTARLVVFDLDGTLVDSSHDLAAGVNAALRRVDPRVPPLSVDEVRGMIGEGASRLVAKALARTGVPRTVEEVRPIFMECYSQVLLERTVPYQGVPEMLDALRPRTLAVLTNKPGGMSRTILEHLGLLPRFLRVYGGGDLATFKPDPEGLLRLLDEAAVPAAEAVLVGDSAIDVRTARAAGVRAIGVDWGFDLDSLRREAPDALLSRPQELLAVV
jgi:phosphoglycolate phosphatase